MPRPPKTTQEAEQRAREIITSTNDIEQLRVAQAVLLPLQGLSLNQTAEVLGRDFFWVSRARNRFIRGEPPLARHGGRRNAYFNEKQETELVMEAFAEYGNLWPGEAYQTSARKMLREKLERATRRPIADSTVSDVLTRFAQRYFPDSHLIDHWQLVSTLQTIARVDRAIRDHQARERSRAGGE